MPDSRAWRPLLPVSSPRVLRARHDRLIRDMENWIADGMGNWALLSREVLMGVKMTGGVPDAMTVGVMSCVSPSG